MEKIRILIVEDEATIATDIELTLLRMGLAVCSVVDSGENALEKIILDIPDLILMDIELSGSLDGIDTAITIREDHDIPVVFLTAHSDKSFLERAKEANPYGYLLKPFQERELYSTIEMALNSYHRDLELKKTKEALEIEIAEHKKHLLDLQKSEEVHRIISGTASDYFYSLKIMPNGQMLINWIGGAFEKVTGFSIEQFVDLERWFTVIHPDDRLMFHTMLEKVKKNQQASVEYRITTSNRKEIWLLDRMRPILDKSENQVLKVYGAVQDISSRKRTMENLAIFEKFAETSSQGFFMADLKAKITYSNQAMVEILDLESSEVLYGKSIFKYVKNRLQSGIDIKIMQHLLHQSYWNGELKLNTDNSNEKIVLANFFIMKDKNDEPQYISGVINDITIRKKAELELKYKTEQINLLLSQQPMAIYVAKPDENNEIIYISDGCLNLTGFEPTDFQSDASFWLNRIHPEDKKVVLDILANISEQDIHSFEYRWKVKNGSYKWFYDIVKLIREKNDEPGQLIGAWVDITGKKLAEIHLKENERRYRRAEKIARFGHWERGVNERVGIWSEEAYNIYGQNPNEFEPSYENVLSVTIPEDRPKIKEIMEKVIQEKRNHLEIEYRILCPDGKEKIIQSVGEVIYNEDRQPEKFIGTVHDVTELRSLVNALKVSENRYEEAGKIAHLGYWIRDFQKNKMIWSQEAHRIFGVDYLHNLKVESLFQLVHPSDKESFKAAIDESISNRQRLDTHCRIIRSDKSIRIVHTVADIIYDSNMQVIGHRGIVHDITEQKLAEEERDRMFSLSIDMMAVAGFDGYFKRVNPAFVKVLGFSTDEMMSKPFFDFVHPDDVLLTHQEMEKLEGGELSINFENRYLTKDGIYKWLSWNAFPFHEDQKIYAVARDITNVKQTQDKLKQAGIVYDNTTEAILITNSDGTIQSANPAFTSITGYELDEVLGKKTSIMKSGKHDPEFYSALWAELKEKGHWSGEIWNKRKNGDIYPEWLNITAVKSEFGDTTNYVAIFSDITKRKEYEQMIEYKAFHDELTGLPNRELFNDRLTLISAQAQRMSQSFAILFMDLDGFKSVNDTYGHELGDKLLKSVSRSLQSIIRKVDTLSRFGGDEFIFILANLSNQHNADRVSDKIMKLFKTPITIDDHSISITASIGIAIYPQDTLDPTELLSKADKAMYYAKARGKNRYELYSNLKD